MHTGGTIAIEARALVATTETEYTSIAATTTFQYTVVFLGTVDGRVIKVRATYSHSCVRGVCAGGDRHEREGHRL
jgi:hypothetical protein